MKAIKTYRRTRCNENPMMYNIIDIIKEDHGIIFIRVDNSKCILQITTFEYKKFILNKKFYKDRKEIIKDLLKNDKNGK